MRHGGVTKSTRHSATHSDSPKASKAMLSGHAIGADTVADLCGVLGTFKARKAPIMAIPVSDTISQFFHGASMSG